jgi:cell division septum initiation protein DivIVA
MTEEPLFDREIRGYAPAEVDKVVALLENALASRSRSAFAEAAATARSTTFGVAWRGYRRGQVDRYVKALLDEMVAIQEES